MKLWQYLIGNFILTITRITSEKDLKRNLTAKRKSLILPLNSAIYKFNSFDEYLEFCNSLLVSKNTAYNLLKDSTLYLYKSQYYLCFHINEKNISSFKSIHYSIIEFGSQINNSELFERKLKEYGKIIFKTNAIGNCVKNFGNI